MPPPPEPDHAVTAGAPLRTGIPWLAQFGLLVVLGVGLAAPFVLRTDIALWVSPLLLLAALACWLSWHRFAATFVQATQPPETAVSAQQSELEQLRGVQHELVRAKQEAEAAMMAKSEFLATMSHEIRTPLNGIIPLLDILMSTRLAPDQIDYLQTAYKSAQELLRIVDDILDYSKIEANKLELENVGLNLRDLVGSVHRLLEKSAEAKNLAFTISLEKGMRLAVRGDQVRLRQILTNLVSNAIKFTNHGSVRLHVSKRGETRTHYEILFTVKDTGIGISPEAAAKLFQPFTQADTSTTRTFGGTGLGLVICKRIVDLMGGKIGLRSEPGKGSLFWFNVPLHKAPGDIVLRRTLDGVRALVLSGDTACVRRLGSYFNVWGINFQQTTATAEALGKLRSATSMGPNWAFDVLIIDTATLPMTSSISVLRDVMRDPALEQVNCLFLLSGAVMPPEFRNIPRATSVPRQYGEGELRSRLLALLGGEEPGSEPVRPLTARSELPEPDPHPVESSGPIVGHVLLVEDNLVNRQVAQRLLSLLGLSFEVAEHGEQALEQLRQKRFDVVLMDCQMPTMDGYAATRAQRQRESDNHLKRIPIIAMTANAMAGDREKCLHAGMDDYMSKPLNRALLERTLRRWLSSATTPVDAKPADVTTDPAPVAHSPLAVESLSSPPPADGKVLDDEIVRDLLDIMGEEFADLVHVYLEDTPKALAALEQAAVRADIEALISPSHSLKSTSANLGAMRLSELAKRLEHGARAGTLGNDMRTLVGEINRSYQRVAQELEALLAKGPAK